MPLGAAANYKAKELLQIDTIVINGNGQLVLNADPNATPIPIPSGLQVTWDAQPYLVQ